MHPVAVGEGVVQALQHHDADAVAVDRAGGRGVEGAAAAVGGEDAARLVDVPGALRHRNADAARERHVALAVEQALRRQVHRDERARAGGLHGQAGAAQAELVGDAGGEEVVVGGEHRLVDAGRRQGLAGGEQVEQQVGVGAGAGEDADRPRVAARVVAGVLERVPGALEEEPVLRVQELRLARREAEERGVEAVGVGDHPLGADVARLRQRLGGHPRRPQLGGGEMRDRLAAGEEALPEALEVGGAGEAAGHADDGDAARPLAAGRAHARTRRRSRKTSAM